MAWRNSITLRQSQPWFARVGSGFTPPEEIPVAPAPTGRLGQSKPEVVACASLLLLLEKGCPPRQDVKLGFARVFIWATSSAPIRSAPGFKASGPGARPGLASGP